MSLVLCSLDEVLKDDVPMYGWAPQDKGQLSSYAFKGDLENLKHHVTRENVDERGLRGYSPLMWACTGGKIVAVRFLLEAGANVNHTDDVGVTPLHVASWYGRKLIVQALIEKGSNVNAYSLPRDGRRNYHTPLHFACRGLVQAETVMRLLIDSGADLHARNGKGDTPLHLAIQRNIRKAKILLKARAKVNEPDRHGNSPLHIAGPHEHIRLLLEFGADVDLENYNGQTPLHTLIDPDDITLFLEYGAGARVLCNKWGCGCGKTVLMCCYSASLWCVGPKFMWNEGCVEAFEKHIIRTKVCGLYLGENNDPAVNPHEIVNWPAAKRDEYRQVCEAEFAQLSDEIPSMSMKITYKDVLYQRPFALSERSMKKVLTLELCEEKFPEYGGLIYSRFIVGQRRLSLVNRCSNFFNLTTPSLTLANFIGKVCSYLNDEDLQELAVVCEAAKKCPTRRIRSKGGSKDYAQQASKVSKKGGPGTSRQGSEFSKEDTPGSPRQASKVSKKGSTGTAQEASTVSKKGSTGTAQEGSKVSKKGSLSSSKQDSEFSKKGNLSSPRHDSEFAKKDSPGTSQQVSKISKEGSPSRKPRKASQQRTLKGKTESPGQVSKLSRRSPFGSEQRSMRSKRSSPHSNQPGPSSGSSLQNTKRFKRDDF